jgi:hypothetical protein
MPTERKPTDSQSVDLERSSVPLHERRPVNARHGKMVLLSVMWLCSSIYHTNGWSPRVSKKAYLKMMELLSTPEERSAQQREGEQDRK